MAETTYIDIARAKTKPTVAVSDSYKKWGRPVVNQGCFLIPAMLLTAQKELGLTATQLTVLLHLCELCQLETLKSNPAIKTIAARLGLTPRQVQRHFTKLEDAGFIERIERYGARGAQKPNIYDLSGLAGKLKALEMKFREI